LVRAGNRLWSSEVGEGALRRLRSAVDTLHRESPGEPGLALAAARALFGSEVELADWAVTALTTKGFVVKSGHLARAGHSPNLAEDDKRLADELAGTLAAAGREPPTVAELKDRLGNRAADVLRYLERAGRVVQVEPDRYYDSTHIKQILDDLASAMSDGRPYSPSELKDVIGSSRKYLIPLLEYCDRRGVTVRDDGGRVWRGA
jgi:selenocysteine-specific elongation factor